MHALEDDETEHQELTASQALDLDAVVFLMGTAPGRRVAWRVLESAGIFRMSHTGNPYETAFREGRRSVGLELLALIVNHMPHSYAAMISENRIET